MSENETRIEIHIVFLRNSLFIFALPFLFSLTQLVSVSFPKFVLFVFILHDYLRSIYEMQAKTRTRFTNIQTDHSHQTNLSEVFISIKLTRKSDSVFQ